MFSPIDYTPQGFLARHSLYTMFSLGIGGVVGIGEGIFCVLIFKFYRFLEFGALL